MVEILSEEPIPDNLNMCEIISEAVHGSYNMNTLESFENVPIGGAECATRLEASGSDASFFRIDEFGKDLGGDDE